jgi:VanZ family protein
MFLRFNLFTILWALIILFLILTPGQQMPNVKDDYLLSIDKIAHTIVFMVLSFLMIVGFKKQYRFIKIKNNAVVSAFIISGSYSLILELMQLLSSERMVQLTDMVANLTGCFLGYIAFIAIYRL